MPTTQVTTDPFVLAAGQSLITTDVDAIRLQSTAAKPPSITIAGAVSATATPALRGFALLSGVRVGDASFYETTIDVAQGGSITVDASGASGSASAYGILSGSWTPVIVNRGAITAIGKLETVGVQSNGAHVQGPTAVTIAGEIRATSTQDLARGVYMSGGDSFANSGLVAATGQTGSHGVEFFQWDSSFLNTGTIRATDTGEGVDSVAVYGATTFGAFVNAGTLEGDFAVVFRDYNGPSDPFPWNVRWTTFENSGRMIGKVDLGYQNQLLLNTGRIDGEVMLGAGDDTLSGRAGTVDGMVSGGDGNDSLLGGAGFDYLQGNAGNDTVASATGDDWLVGGQGADLINGGDGRNIVYGNLGDDFLGGWGGDDLVRGGQGADTLQGHDGADWLSGDKGDDVLAGGAGADIFHTFGETGLDRVTDFNAAEGDRVQLDPGTTYSVTQVGADVAIDMGGGGRMLLVGATLSALPAGWIFGA
ncbi:MAG TPA: calcium-binding protein [Phytomonospora sp.]